MIPIRQQFTLFAFYFLTASSAAAGPILSGPVTLIDPPPSLENHTLESNSKAVVFREMDLVTVHEDLLLLERPSWKWLGNFQWELVEVSQGVIPAGSKVQTHMIHFDPEATGDALSVSGRIEFAERIIGVLHTPYGLNRTDQFGSELTDYVSRPELLTFLGGFSSFRGIDFRGVPPGQWVSSYSSGGRHHLDFTLLSEGNPAGIRIFTVVPEPVAALAMIQSVLFVFARRFRY